MTSDEEVKDVDATGADDSGCVGSAVSVLLALVLTDLKIQSLIKSWLRLVAQNTDVNTTITATDPGAAFLPPESSKTNGAAIAGDLAQEG